MHFLSDAITQSLLIFPTRFIWEHLHQITRGLLQGSNHRTAALNYSCTTVPRSIADSTNTGQMVTVASGLDTKFCFVRTNNFTALQQQQQQKPLKNTSIYLQWIMNTEDASSLHKPLCQFKGSERP